MYTPATPPLPHRSRAQRAGGFRRSGQCACPGGWAKEALGCSVQGRRTHMGCDRQPNDTGLVVVAVPPPRPMTQSSERRGRPQSPRHRTRSRPHTEDSWPLQQEVASHRYDSSSPVLLFLAYDRDKKDKTPRSSMICLLPSDDKDGACSLPAGSPPAELSPAASPRPGLVASMWAT